MPSINRHIKMYECYINLYSYKNVTLTSPRIKCKKVKLLARKDFLKIIHYII